MPYQAKNEEGLDLNAYRLLAKAGYDSKDFTGLGTMLIEATGEKVHGLNFNEKMLKKKGYTTETSKVGIGYSPHTPI